MNAEKWQTTKNGQRMLEAVAASLSPRKWELLGLALLKQFHPAQLAPHLPVIENCQRRLCGLALHSGPGSAVPSLAEVSHRQRGIVEKFLPRTRQQNYAWLHEHGAQLPTAKLSFAASAYAQDSIDRVEVCYENLADAVGTVLLLGDQPQSFLDLVSQVRAAETARLFANDYTALAHRFHAKAEELDAVQRQRSARLIRSQVDEYIDSVELTASDHQERGRSNVNRWFQRLLASTLREQLGDPYAWKPLPNEARTETALALARGILNAEDAGRGLLLADALEEAGGVSAAALQHLRSEGGHQRGCWVLEDLLQLDPETFAEFPLSRTTSPQGRSQRLGPYSPPDPDVA